MKYCIIAALVTVSLFGCEARKTSQSMATTPKKKNKISISSDTTTEDLIKLLSSPNKPLNPEGTSDIIQIPSSYDTEAQEQIDIAIELLKERKKEAFPLLIANINNEHYCRTYATSIERDFSVGETCMDIFSSHFDDFKCRRGYREMPRYTSSVINPDPKGWWILRSGMSYDEIRIEALRWTIEEERKMMDINNNRPKYLSAISQSDWHMTYIHPLEDLLVALQKEAEQAAPRNR